LRFCGKKKVNNYTHFSSKYIYSILTGDILTGDILMADFDIQSFSIIGRKHAIHEDPNQDYSAIYEGESFLIATICDGCSGARSSHFGSMIGSQIFNAEVAKIIPFHFIDECTDISLVEHNVRCIVMYAVAELRKTISHIVGKLYSAPEKFESYHAHSRLTILMDYFLFTLLSVIVTKKYAIIIACGDGVFYRDGAELELAVEEPFSQTYVPEFLCELFGPSAKPCPIKIMVTSVDKIKNMFIASDGVLYLPDTRNWKEEIFSDSVFNDPNSFEKYLYSYKEFLPDDTTLVCLKRQNNGKD